MSSRRGGGSLRTEETVNILINQPETELYDELKIEENEILKHPKIKKKLKSLIYRYRLIFATPEHGVGRTDIWRLVSRLKKHMVMHPRVEAEFQKQVN